MGFLRLFLALSVIAGHSGGTVLGFRGIGAWYAVNFFFIISGFYMAMVLNEKYKTLSPVVFYKSRMLRLFPTYYVGLALALVVSFGSILSNFDALTLGSKVYFVLQNLFIFGQDLSYLVCAGVTSQTCASPVNMSVNPPAWSLAVELGFYLIAPFVLKSGRKTCLFVMLGCAYLLLLNGVKFPLEGVGILNAVGLSAFNYYFYPSSFVFFGGGALAYHVSKKNFEPNYIAAIAVIGFLSFTVTVMPFWHLLFFSMAVPVLFQYTKSNKVDRLVGELSYPAYILHFPILLYVKKMAASGPEYFSFIGVGTWVGVLSCALGLLVYFFVDKRVDSYRHSSEFLAAKLGRDSLQAVALSRALVVVYIVLPFLVIASVYASQWSAKPTSSHTAFNLTDGNWVNGVSIRSSAFFVSNTSSNVSDYKAGVKLKFSNGDIRLVEKVVPAGQYLHVYVGGSILDGNVVGYPSEITIMK